MSTGTWKVAAGLAALTLLTLRSPAAVSPVPGATPGTTMGASFASCVNPAVAPWASVIVTAAQQFGVPKELLAALVLQESSGQQYATNFSQSRYLELANMQSADTLPSSLQGALAYGWTLEQLATSIGLAEVEGDTAWDDLGAHYSYATIFDAGLNTRLGAKYLARMFNTFGSWRTALAAYNAGPGRVAAGTAPVSSYTDYADVILAEYQRILTCESGG